jgi:hypothetical protein
MSKDLYVVVRIPEEDIDGDPFDFLNDTMQMNVAGQNARVTIAHTFVFDGTVVQASVGRVPS